MPSSDFDTVMGGWYDELTLENGSWRLIRSKRSAYIATNTYASMVAYEETGESEYYRAAESGISFLFDMLDTPKSTANKLLVSDGIEPEYTNGLYFQVFENGTVDTTKRLEGGPLMAFSYGYEFFKDNKTLSQKSLDSAIRYADYMISDLSSDDGFYLTKDRVLKRSEQQGQVIIGLLDLYEITREEKYLEHAIKAGDFLLKMQLVDGLDKGAISDGEYYDGGDNGKRLDSYHISVPCYSARAFHRLFEVTGNPEYLNGGYAAANWIMKMQNEDGGYNWKIIKQGGNFSVIEYPKYSVHQLGMVPWGVRPYLKHDPGNLYEMVEKGIYWAYNSTEVGSSMKNQNHGGFFNRKMIKKGGNVTVYQMVRSYEIGIEYLGLYETRKFIDAGFIQN